MAKLYITAIVFGERRDCLPGTPPSLGQPLEGCWGRTLETLLEPVGVGGQQSEGARWKDLRAGFGGSLGDGSPNSLCCQPPEAFSAPSSFCIHITPTILPSCDSLLTPLTLAF